MDQGRKSVEGMGWKCAAAQGSAGTCLFTVILNQAHNQIKIWSYIHDAVFIQFQMVYRFIIRPGNLEKLWGCNCKSKMTFCKILRGSPCMHTRAVHDFMLGPQAAWHAHVMYLKWQHESLLHDCVSCHFVGLTNLVPCEGTKLFATLISYKIQGQGWQPMCGQNTWE